MRASTLWFWHIVAGAVILILLSVHMAIMHLNDIMTFLGIHNESPVDAASVFARSRQAFFMITYILLLGAALFHGLYGFRTIVLELTLSQRFEKVLTAVLVLAGLALFVYGTYAAIAIYQMKEVLP